MLRQHAETHGKPLITGGTGKTHLATGLWDQSLPGRVAFATAAQSVTRLAEAHAAGWLRDELTRLGRIPLIVVDGVGYIPLEPDAANLFGRDPQSVGEACCALMEAVDLLGDAERVGRWADAVEGFRRTYDLPWPKAHGQLSPVALSALSAFCGSCCAGIYLVTGRLYEAKEELTAAIGSLENDRVPRTASIR